MNIYKKLLLLLPIIVLSSSGCKSINTSSGSSNETENDSGSTVTPSQDANANKKSKNYYQLLVYSFADSNGDGIGDFKGIVDKLDYLVDLGVEGLWLSPVNKCTSYHGYDVTDYYGINPSYEYGSYNYEYLLSECHKRNISVIMDLVINHVSVNHSWNSGSWKSAHPGWFSGQNAFYGTVMVDLNFDNTEVQQEMINVGKHWLNKGVDGFRLDAAMWLFNNEGNNASQVDHTKNYTYWNRWCNEMRATNPDCYIIGEVLNSDHDLSYQYAHAGFNSTFDFNVRRNVYAAVNGSTDYVDKTLTDMNKALTINQSFILGRALSNHDIGRFTQQHNGMADEPAYYFTDFARIRLANALNIMMRGNTFIYYGDELGLQGHIQRYNESSDSYQDLNYRTPMPWASSNGLTVSTSYITSEVNSYSNRQTLSNTTLSGHTAEQDKTDPNSLYACVKALLNIKKDSDAIKNGTLAKITGLPTGLQGYTLSNGTKTISFIYNPTNSNVNYQISQDVLYATDSYTNNVSISSKGFIVTSN